MISSKGHGVTRQAAYRQSFKHYIPESSMAETREATNKAWVLGSIESDQ